MSPVIAILASGRTPKMLERALLSLTGNDKKGKINSQQHFPHSRRSGNYHTAHLKLPANILGDPDLFRRRACLATSTTVSHHAFHDITVWILPLSLSQC